MTIAFIAEGNDDFVDNFILSSLNNSVSATANHRSVHHKEEKIRTAYLNAVSITFFETTFLSLMILLRDGLLVSEFSYNLSGIRQIISLPAA